MSARSLAALVAEILRLTRRSERRRALERVPLHQRAAVEAQVRRFWPQRGAVRRQQP